MSNSANKPNGDITSPNGDCQAPAAPFAEFSARVRALADKKGLTSGGLAGKLGVTRTTFGRYWDGSRLPPSDTLIELSDTLGVSARWLVRGEEQATSSPNALVDAGWVQVPEYNLREASSGSLGPSVGTIPLRRDWLNQTLRTSSDLWLTQLLAGYRSAGLEEGALVICRTIPRLELIEGNICLWRIHESIAVGKFSFQPDVALAQGIIGGLPGAQLATGAIGAIRDRAMGFGPPELVVSPSQIGDEVGRYHLVGRIVGTFIRPI